MHIPVLLKETLEFLDLKPGKFIIDGTVDGGGHSSEIIKKIGPNGKLLGLDWDKDMMSLALKNLKKLAKENKVELILVNKNYAELTDVLQNKNLGLADGLLLDLGFSSLHIESSGRGFSFLRNEPLIMTYNDNSLPAYEFLKRAQFDELSSILKDYGEERYAVQIAKKIIEKRRTKKIENTFDLVEIIKEAVPSKYLHQKIHPATKTFQALRIYLNKELENLKKVLSEIKNIVSDNNIFIKQLDIDLPEIQDIDAHNVIKAKLIEALKHKKGSFIIEDTSLYLDCLNGLPGPLIKFFLNTIGNEGLFNLTKKLKNNKALAKTIIGYAKNKKEIKFFEGVIEGEIVSPRGDFGFGWDKIFKPKGFNKTFSQMEEKEKSKISMRKIAAEKLKNFLKKQLKNKIK